MVNTEMRLITFFVAKDGDTMDRGSQHCTGGANKIIPRKKKCTKAKWLSEEALLIAEERRKVKSKEERERYTHN